MQGNMLFAETDDTRQLQTKLGLDDGGGLRLVNSRCLDERKFGWDLFDGYDSLRVLTYSASVNAIVRMLDKYSFTSFECIFGYQGVLRDIKDIISFQKVIVGYTRAAIMGLKDDRHIHILEKVHDGRAHFYVLRKYVAHAKLYLLSSPDGRTRVIVGSANLSERAFSGDQSETLVKFDNDEKAWSHYNRMFDQLRDAATDEIPLPEDKIMNAPIEITETPVMTNSSATLVIDSPSPDEMEVTAPVQIARVEKVAASIAPNISAAIPPVRSGKQKITPEIKRDISRIRLVKSADEADNRYFSLDRVNRSALLSGERFPLEWDTKAVKTDELLLLNYFKNYEDAFEGNMHRLKRASFIFMALLYFSPFIG